MKKKSVSSARSPGLTSKQIIKIGKSLSRIRSDLKILESNLNPKISLESIRSAERSVLPVLLPMLAGAILAGRTDERDDLLGILNPDRPQSGRLESARRVARRLGNVIHKTRWKWVLEEMEERALQHHSSPRKEFEDLIVGCLFEMIECVRTFWDIDECYATLKTLLNQRATDDALSTDWRKRTGAQKLREVKSKAERGTDYGIAEIQAYLTAEMLSGKAKLSTLERQVFSKHLLEDKTLHRIARELKKTPDNVRQAWFQARQKLKKILKPS
jgi:DNA-directed RNA polymerase specialized sigma24 family protein